MSEPRIDAEPYGHADGLPTLRQALLVALLGAALGFLLGVLGI